MYKFKHLLQYTVILLSFFALTPDYYAKRPVVNNKDICLSNKELLNIAKKSLSEMQVIDQNITLTDVKTIIKSTGVCASLEEIMVVLEQYKKSLNSPPSISGISAESVTEGNYYFFTPETIDANNDVLTFSVTNLPRWANFDTSTGALYGTPLVSDIGYYSEIGITVSDGIDTASLPNINIMVSADTIPTEENSLLNDIVGYSLYLGTSQETTYLTTLDIGLGITYSTNILVDETYSFSIEPLDINGNNIFISNDYIEGFRIYAGTTSNALFLVGERACFPNSRFSISNLTAGTYYISITVFDANGHEGPLSDIMQIHVM